MIRPLFYLNRKVQAVQSKNRNAILRAQRFSAHALSFFNPAFDLPY